MLYSAGATPTTVCGSPLRRIARPTMERVTGEAALPQAVTQDSHARAAPPDRASVK